jgi:hypothetical protein
MGDKAVPVATPDEAKARALAIIEAHKECVSFVRPEDLETSPLFVPVVSVIKPTKDEFYDPIPGIGIMARPPLVNLMREKAGINILRTETSKRGEWVWLAHVYGEKRQPDGTMMPGDASYEFDAEKRAELDAINQPQKYGNEIAKRRHMLELGKFGEQRAVTGAQHSLIHKLAHAPRIFKSVEELTRGMILLRIDLNTDAMFNSPDMREAVIAHAVGATRTLFGPVNGMVAQAQRNVTPSQARIEPETTPAGGQADADEPDPFDTAQPTPVVDVPTPEQEARAKLEEWLASEVVKAHRPKAGIQHASEAIKALLARPDAPLAELEGMIAKCQKLAELQASRAGGAT